MTVSVEIDPLQPIQGGLLLIRASANQHADFSVSFDRQSVPLASQGDDRCLALVGIDACEPAGDHIIEIEASTASGQRATVRTLVAVQEGKFTTEWLTLSADKLALLAPEITQPEAQYLVDVCSTFSTPKYWLGAFEVPWSGKTNSPFGARRSYNGETPSSCHRGMDIDGEGGEPVRAANDAVVALAEELKVRGNAIVLDHGWGVFSGYWHLDEILVNPGERVDKGEVIGYLGNTGLSTGAHLHWEIRVHNVFVDPLIFTQQELPRPPILQ
ncbi:MAG: M23 family metallopeptidase [Anaerolineae bacterium]|nr:M23 family metallopeptidase [Anaerolineae bacterium]